MATLINAPGGGGSAQIIRAPGRAAQTPISAPGPTHLEEPQDPDNPRIIQAPGPPPKPSTPPPATKPKPPKGATAISGELQVILAWISAPDAVSYNVKRSVISGGPYTIIQSLIGTSFTDVAVAADINYFYVFSSVNGGGEGVDSTEVSARPTAIGIPPNPEQPPAPPTNLVAQAGLSQITLSWTASPGALTYEISRATESGGPYISITTGLTALSYVNAGLTNLTPYSYVVFARNAAGLGGASNQATAKTGAPLNAPAGVAASAGVRQVVISWHASPFAASYRLKRSGTSGGPYTVIRSLTGTTHTDEGLVAQIPVFYVVSLVDADGTESANSEQVSAIPTGSIVTPPNAPVLQVTAGNGQNAITWSAIPGGTAPTPIAVVARGTLSTNVDADLNATNAFTPAANKLLVACYSAQRVLEEPTTPAVTGHGTWTLIDSLYYSTNVNTRRKIFLFACVTGGSPSSAPVTFLHLGSPLTGAEASVFEISNADVSQGLAQAFVQVAKSAGDLPGGSTLSIPLGAAGHTSNRPFSFFSHAVADTTEPRVNWAEIHDVTHPTSPPQGFESQWRPDAFDTDASAQWASSTLRAGMAFEIRALVVGGVIYKLKRSLTSGGPYTVITPADFSATSFIDTSVVNGTQYHYVATANNQNGESVNSNEGAGTPMAPQAPATPGPLSGSSGNGQVTLNWPDVAGAVDYSGCSPNHKA